MRPGIKRLIAISENKEAQLKSEQTLEHQQLIKSWVKSNYLRSSVALGVGLAGLWVSQ